jgi:hypothetical protein
MSACRNLPGSEYTPEIDGVRHHPNNKNMVTFFKVGDVVSFVVMNANRRIELLSLTRHLGECGKQVENPVQVLVIESRLLNPKGFSACCDCVQQIVARPH